MKEEKKESRERDEGRRQSYHMQAKVDCRTRRVMGESIADLASDD